MTKLKVGVVASDVPSCELYRARGPAEVLAARGEIEFEMLNSGLRVRHAVRAGREHEPVGIIDPPEVDVIVLTRGVFPKRVVEVIPLLQREGIAVCVDIDDDYERLPTMLQSLYKINPTLNPGYNWRNVRDGCRIADLVTISTPPLIRYRQDALLLRNAVPARYLDITADRDGSTVGWGGTVYGHIGDLRVPRAGVAAAIRECQARFLNVGDGVDVQKDLGLDSPPAVTGIVSLDDYAGHLARFDIGIAPLVENAYSRAKSWLKYLESLSLGSYVVASDSPEYMNLQADLEDWCSWNDSPVPGALAEGRGRDWRRKLLKALRRSENEREDMSNVAREFVRERHSIEGNAWRWAEAWEEAVKRCRS